MSQSSNTTESAVRRANFRVVLVDGSMAAPSITPPRPSSPSAGTTRLSIAGCEGQDWDARHATDSTFGEAPKKGSIESGKIFSNAVNDFLAANPEASHLLAMAQEFERAFVEAANQQVADKNMH